MRNRYVVKSTVSYKKKKITRKKKVRSANWRMGFLPPIPEDCFSSFLSFHGLFFLLRSAREIRAKGRAKLAGDDRWLFDDLERQHPKFYFMEHRRKMLSNAIDLIYFHSMPILLICGNLLI